MSRWMITGDNFHVSNDGPHRIDVDRWDDGSCMVKLTYGPFDFDSEPQEMVFALNKREVEVLCSFLRRKTNATLGD